MNKTEEFINKAIKIHGNKYDYSTVNYVKAMEKIIIICKIHGEFNQTPNGHLSGKGCFKCIDRTSQKSNKDDFIQKAINIHGDKYDYSLFEYINCKTKGIIICKIHGNFLQDANNHLSGKQCSKCSNVYKCSTEEFILKANQIHNDIYDYSEFNYINNNTKGIIICNLHGKFLQNPANHLLGNGCPKCGIEKTKQKMSFTKEEFIKRAIEIHGDKYNYCKVDYINTQTKVIINCRLHGDFKQTPGSHLSGHCCIKCSKNYSYTTEEFIQKLKEIHGNKYNYSNVEYKTAKDKIKIICDIHGDFFQTASCHLYGSGCELCARITRGNNKKSNNDEFIEKSIKIHENKYDYSKVEYINSQTEVIIICKIHGEFKQKPNGHLDGNGCIKCGMKRSAEAKKYSTEDFIKKSIKIHGDKFDYSKANYIDGKTDIVIICKKHGDFLQKPSNHYYCIGCPKCYTSYSKGQIEWLNFFSSFYNINIQHAENDGEFIIPSTNYKADGYCQETNTIWEYHGRYYHGCPKFYDSEQFNKTTNCTFGELYDKTLEKELKIYELGYKLITIWDYEWDNVKKSVKILQQKFRNKLK